MNYIYAIHQENSYGKWVAALLHDALKAGMDGFYFDFFDYSMSENPSREFRHTYNLSLSGWDNRSVDAVGNSTGPRAVARRKVDLNWLTTPARAAAIDAALGSVAGLGRFVANGNAAGDSSPIRHRPVVRFWEGCEESGYTRTHLSTAPMSLGWYDGYTAEVLNTRLDRTGLADFWRTWDNCTGLACDKNVFDDIKEKLSFGLLYFSYFNPSFSDFSLRRKQSLTLPSVLTHYYPITVRDIRPGTISGDERIITLHSGAYRFRHHGDSETTTTQTATLFCYTVDGVALAPKAVSATGPHNSFAVLVPVDGACVLERAVDSASEADDGLTMMKTDDS